MGLRAPNQQHPISIDTRHSSLLHCIARARWYRDEKKKTIKKLRKVQNKKCLSCHTSLGSPNSPAATTPRGAPSTSRSRSCSRIQANEGPDSNHQPNTDKPPVASASTGSIFEECASARLRGTTIRLSVKQMQIDSVRSETVPR